MCHRHGLGTATRARLPEQDEGAVSREERLSSSSSALHQRGADHRFAESGEAQQAVEEFVSWRMNPGRLLLKAPPPSEEKAAATIQAHWRGLGVRRTKPLEQLEVIYHVRQDLKAHMAVLADAAMYEKLCLDAQERLKWSECAMALLLRLDSVQGAHLHVRDIRKVVTKEVITFQELVDSTSEDASSGKALVVKHDRRPSFQSLYFALQQRDWIFVSSKHLHSHL